MKIRHKLYASVMVGFVIFEISCIFFAKKYDNFLLDITFAGSMIASILVGYVLHELQILYHQQEEVEDGRKR